MASPASITWPTRCGLALALSAAVISPDQPASGQAPAAVRMVADEGEAARYWPRWRGPSGQGMGAGSGYVLSTRGKDVQLAMGAPLTLKLSEPLTVRIKG